jgi:asparagine synthase (glutamine-hydrolysing)
MCGIAGIVDFAGIDAVDLAPRLRQALARLARRGPDGQGTWHDDRCALVHTRLAVIDLSEAAAQPMAGHGGVIAFNGEIYNFASLAAELRDLGHRFVSRSDTEVLLAGWRAWGAGLLDRLVGMFAFALWNAEAGELILACDRFGKKPLVYRHHATQLAFGSDLVALSYLAGATSEIDPTALRLLFALRYIPAPWTIRAGIRKLPAGHLAVFSRRGIHVRRWYSLAKSRPPRYRDEAEAAADLRRHLDTAVADRLVADVPVGAFLSGGIDSAIIAASLAAQGKSVRTFTVGFPGASAYYEERPAARAVARHLGIDHTEIEVGPAETRRVLDDVFDGFDEPFADSSAIPTYLLARETRRQVTVALSGDGADEVFGGYRKYLGELYAERYQRLPAWVRRQVIAPLARCLPEGKDGPWRERSRRLRRFLAHADQDAAARQAGWMRDLTEAELDRLFAPAVAATETDVESLVAVLREETDGGDPINAMLAADIALVLAGDMLVKVDRMSMHHALEVRCPYLDQRVVECAAAMPGSFKLADGTGKRILRRAFAERLPAEVFVRPKKGFEVPIAAWLTGDLVETTRRAIDPERLRRQGLFRPELPQRWFADLKAGRRDTAWSLWTMVVFQAWIDRQGAGLAIAAS